MIVTIIGTLLLFIIFSFTYGIGRKNPGTTFTFEEALEMAGYGRVQHKVTIAGGLIAMASFISSGAVSFIMTAAECDLQMNSVQKGSLISAGFIGMILSCHMWGFLSDTKGRRYILLRCLISDGLMYAITSFMPTYHSFLILRFIHGFVICGSIVPCYPYIGELHTNKYRNRALLIASIMACVANLYQPGVSILVNLKSWQIELLPFLTYKPWRLYYALSGVPSLIAAALMYTLSESPMFLLAIGDEKGSIKTLNDIYEKNLHGDKTMKQFLVNNIVMEEDKMVTKMDSNSNKTSMFLHLIWEQTAPLLKKPYRFNLALVTSMQFLLFLCNNNIFMWVPETLNRIGLYYRDANAKPETFCTIIQHSKSINFSSNTDDNHSGLQNNSSMFPPTEGHGDEHVICSEKINIEVYICVASTGILIMICMVVIYFSSRVIGKRLILGVSISAGFILIISLLFTKNTFLMITEMCCFMMVSAATTQVVLYSMVDFFPTKIRSMAVCLGIMASRLGSITSNQLSGALIDSYCTTILFTTLTCLSVCMVINFFLPTQRVDQSNQEHIKKEPMGCDQKLQV